MNREDQDFDQLRRLLKLKRYEQPPPRYFNDFSAQVMARLQASQASSAGHSWWQRIWAGLELRPALPVALSAAVCGLLVLGAVYSETAQVPAGLVHPPIKQPTDNERPAVDMATFAMMGQAASDKTGSSSTNPVSTVETLFNHVPQYEIWRAGHPMFR